MFIKIAPGGALFVVYPITLAIMMASLGGPLGLPWLVPLSSVPFSVTLFCLYFFRNPDRFIGQNIVSPADGKVIKIDQIDDPDLGPCDRLAIFMSPLDVHVNRAPWAMDVKKITHFPGKHLPAFSKESERNEKRVYEAKLGDTPVKIVQIAGAVARRTMSYVEPGVHVAKGAQFGIIKLSSRVDLIVPRGKIKFTVVPKQKIKAGTSTIGVWA